MPDWSRRRALRAAAAAGAFALAGCSDGPSRSSEVPLDRADPVPPSDLEVTFVRDTEARPLFAVEDGSDDDSGEDTPSDPPDDDPALDSTRSEYLTDGADRERLAFRSTTAAEDLRAFVEGSDLGSRSVYVIQRPIGECFEAHLVGVYREGDGVDADFCRTFRPADVDCSTDARDTVGVGVRLPFPGDSSDGHGTDWSSDCERRPTVAAEGGEGS